VKLVLAAVLSSLVMAYRSLGSVILDGSSWKVRIRAKSLFALPKRDRLVFERGRFTSSRYLSSGYLPSGYAAHDGAEGASAFTASLIREDGSTVDWVGEVDGDRMKGTVVWQKVGGKERRYSFKGRRQPGVKRSKWRRRTAGFVSAIRAPFRRFQR
jgi:hypothetical protein